MRDASGFIALHVMWSKLTVSFSIPKIGRKWVPEVANFLFWVESLLAAPAPSHGKPFRLSPLSKERISTGVLPKEYKSYTCRILLATPEGDIERGISYFLIIFIEHPSTWTLKIACSAIESKYTGCLFRHSVD
jgi:hypothetical protein